MSPSSAKGSASPVEEPPEKPSPTENGEDVRDSAEESASEGEVSNEGEEASRIEPETGAAAPPLPSEDAAPPLPSEPAPGAASAEDDGWDCQWDQNTGSWFFYNRFTHQTQWENPRVSTGESASTADAAAPQPPATEKPAAGGYNPAIHGDYDPTAWYAQSDSNPLNEPDPALVADPYAAVAGAYESGARFNRVTGQFQTDEMGPERHTDEAKSRRQMNAFFDVDAAANSHDGRSLKAERAHKKLSRSELKAFKEKRKSRKEEKRRAWLRD